MAAHGPQLGKIELKPDHKHQKHDTEFAQMANTIRIFRQRQRIRADDDTNRQITQHGGELERTARDYAQNCGEQVHQSEVKRGHCLILARDPPVYKITA